MVIAAFTPTHTPNSSGNYKDIADRLTAIPALEEDPITTKQIIAIRRDLEAAQKLAQPTYAQPTYNTLQQQVDKALTPHYERIRAAADQLKGVYVTYHGEPISVPLRGMKDFLLNIDTNCKTILHKTEVLYRCMGSVKAIYSSAGEAKAISEQPLEQLPHDFHHYFKRLEVFCAPYSHLKEFPATLLRLDHIGQIVLSNNQITSLPSISMWENAAKKWVSLCKNGERENNFYILNLEGNPVMLKASPEMQKIKALFPEKGILGSVQQ